MEKQLHPDPKAVGRFFRHEHLTDEEIATIRERSAAIDNDLLSRSEREAKAGARVIFWGEANAPVLKQDEGDLIRRNRREEQRHLSWAGAGELAFGIHRASRKQDRTDSARWNSRLGIFQSAPGPGRRGGNPPSR